MPTKNDKKWLIGGLIGFTVILLITAVVLFFQLKPPAPAPSPKPRPSASPELPEVQQTTPKEVCSVSFTVTASPSPSPSPSPSASPQPTACFDTCESDAQCEEDLRCMTVSGTKRCVNPACTEDADCSCASPQPSPSPQAQASASPAALAQAQPSASPRAVEQAELPTAGVNTPLVLGVSSGILMMLIGLLAL